jgi:ribosomal protein S18 acetylase RimI-like enzyme
LQDLYVSAQHRGSGAGQALMEAVFTAADAGGRSDVYWMTQSFNTEAWRLYDRIGVETPFIKYRR